MKITQGILWALLESQNDMMCKLAKNNRFQTIKGAQNFAFNLNLLFNLYHSTFDLLASTFSVKFKHADFLGETMASYYIRLCYFNFVKIYSYISNSEILKIGQKVLKRQKESRTMPRESAQVLGDIDPFGVHRGGKPDIGMLGQAENDQPNKRKHSFPILLSKIYLKIVLNIALNRNEAAKNIFYQFRIMEFFYKEIDLEFEINQIKERFHQIRNNAKERVSRAASPKKAFQEQSDDSDSNEINIYSSANKMKKNANKIFAPESGFVPKLNFNNLTSGGNPLKISSKNQPDPTPSIQSKSSVLDFIDRGSLPIVGKAPATMLKIGKLNQNLKDHKSMAVSAPPNKFALDFTKLVPKQPQKDESSRSRSLDSSTDKVPPIMQQDRSDVATNLVRPNAISMVPKLGQPKPHPAIGLLQLGNIERGTPVQMPDISIGGSNKSSDSSQSIEINYEEVEKAKQEKNQSGPLEKQDSSLSSNEDFLSEGNDRNNTKTAVIEERSIFHHSSMVPKLPDPKIGVTEEGNIFLKKSMQDIYEGIDKDRLSINSEDNDSSSSVIGVMPPPSFQAPKQVGLLGIGKCKT
jgi:hypothetical protein